MQIQADECWAQSVERQIQESSMSTEELAEDPNGTEQTGSEDVFLLRVGGNNTEGLRQRLLYGPEFESCRNALEVRGQMVELPQKALILVEPMQYRNVIAALRGRELKYFHIAISQRYELTLNETLKAFPYKQRPKVKHNREALRWPSPEDAGTVDSNIEGVFVEKRSFLCVVPIMRTPQSVTQSTTEAISESATQYSRFRGVNPRRHIVQWDAMD